MCCPIKGYLKKYKDTFLSPSLPLHKLHSIQRMGFGSNNKIFLEFEQPFWDEDCELIYIVWEDETDLCDVVSDVKASWIRKLTGFTVLKPTERYVKYTYSKILLLQYKTSFYCIFTDLDMCSVDGLQGMNPSTWRHCLNLKCCTVSRSCFVKLQVTLLLF